MKASVKLAFLLTIAATGAQAAVLRPIGSLAAGTVRLSDLFDDLAAGEDRVLGPAPAPGGRIVVEAPQLAAIARQFGVDWRATPGDRAVLERPGRLLTREELIPPLRTALNRLGAPDDAELDLPGFVAPLIPSEAKPEIAIEQLDYQAGPNGRFTAGLVISAAGMGSQRLRIAGTLIEMVDLPALVHRLLPGAVVVAANLGQVHARASSLRGEVVQTADQAIGLAAHRTLLPGQPLLLADLGKPILVAKGARVAMQLLTGGLTVLANGQALGAGALGDRINVLNPSSRAVVEAEVIANGRVRVLPDSTPLVPAGGTRFRTANYGALVR